jgi:hypothetical protein
MSEEIYVAQKSALSRLVTRDVEQARIAAHMEASQKSF